MKLSVSNIAWKSSDQNRAMQLLKENGIKYVDVAPTLLSDSIKELDVDAVLNYHKTFDIKIVAMQSLLFPFPNVSLFDNETSKTMLMSYLRTIFALAQKLKVKNLVFGSPKNRYVNDIEAFSVERAIDIFREISDLAKQHYCVICFEANPKEYGCNFIISTQEAIEFVRLVDHDGLKLNLDISTVVLNNESMELILQDNIDIIQHIHLSSPFIKDILSMDNDRICGLLKKYKYDGYLTMECKFAGDDALVSLKSNIECFVERYGS
jgi:D-psicose/D-tagatose/L-ribulose 3-epimerase